MRGVACSSATNSSSSRGARAGAVVERGGAAQPELRGALGERLGEQRDRGGAVRRAAPARGGPARRPRSASVAREARPGADAARAGRCAGRAPASSRGGRARAAATAAATNWSRWARRTAGAPLSSSSRSGRKTLSSGRSRRRAGARPARRRQRHALGLRRGCEADAQLVRVRRRRRAARRRASPARRSAPARARCGSVASGRCSRSRAPRAGSTCRRRWGRGRPSGPSPRCASARA